MKLQALSNFSVGVNPLTACALLGTLGDKDEMQKIVQALERFPLADIQVSFIDQIASLQASSQADFLIAAELDAHCRVRFVLPVLREAGNCLMTSSRLDAPAATALRNMQIENSTT